MALRRAILEVSDYWKAVWNVVFFFEKTSYLGLQCNPGHVDSALFALLAKEV